MARLPPVTDGASGFIPAEAAFKVLIVGDAGVGKTSIIKRYCHDVYSNVYRATIGVDFALKRVRLADGTEARYGSLNLLHATSLHRGAAYSVGSGGSHSDLICHETPLPSNLTPIRTLLAILRSQQLMIPTFVLIWCDLQLATVGHRRSGTFLLND